MQTSSSSGEAACPDRAYRNPAGHEKGTFWSINLGGSMLRIALCTFGPGRHQLVGLTRRMCRCCLPLPFNKLYLLQAEMEQFEVRMKREQLTCHASQLFDDIAQSLLDFAKSIGRCARLCSGLPTTCWA